MAQSPETRRSNMKPAQTDESTDAKINSLEATDLSTTPIEIPIQVLLIEDSPFDAKLITAILEKAPDAHRYWVIQTKKISKAIKLLERSHFDVVILDLTLPDSHGTSAVEEIHQRFPTLPIVVVTGTEDYQVGIAAVKQGAQDYLIKGKIEPAGLTKSLQFALSRSRALSDLRKAVEDERHIAQHDHLTGIPNRKMFEFGMSQTLKQIRRSPSMAAILFFDLNGFKKINDTYGHQFGDVTLQTVAKRIQTSIRESDLVARLGGDEFAVILRDIHRPDDAGLVAHNILRAIEEPIPAIGHSLKISASVGISIYPLDAQDQDTLLKFADTAMYAGKGSEKYKCQFFNPMIQAQVIENADIEQSLLDAWNKQEFVLHFQPQFDLRSGKILGMEALARWKYQGIGLVSAGEFVPFAEKSGLIFQINDWLFKEAGKAAKVWSEQHGIPLRVAANISAQQLRHEGFVIQLEKLFKEIKLEPSQLCLEFHEAHILDELPRYLPRIRELKNLGVCLALDHFGPGSTSLNQLKESMIDEIKMDCSLIDGFLKDPALTEAMIHAAHCLGLKVNAQGIESKEQLQMLKNLGCDSAQGFLLGRPTSPDFFETALQTGDFFKTINEASAAVTKKDNLV